MSRVLPPRPNLEHLRNQAKDLLHDWQQRKPDAQLADAQHAIALEYGFPSWPKLKAHVESLIADDPRPSAAPASDNPFLGTWIANLDASKRHPANQFIAATLALAVDGDTVTITHTGRDAAGRDEQSTNTIQVDGREHPTAPGSGYVLIARWRGSRALETVARKDGQVVGGGSYEVSASGKTLTVSTRRPGANADGWSTEFEQVIVFDRASS
jgi:endonuclease YncB( thermonuclease family)